MTRIFIDATTLIALGTIGELDLLGNFTDRLVVLPLIRDEVTTEPAQTNLSRFIRQYEVETEDPAIHDRIPQAKDVLGESTENGDVHLIAAVLAYTSDGRPIAIISDDRRVRTTAQGLGATVTGTIGVVVRAVDDGLSSKSAHEVIDRIDSRGLHMTGSLREKAYSLIEDAAGRSSSQ